ncbi:MAG: DUF4197 domain-containing protein [Candidatus Nitrohelix vancouverensis]|uniref:DUF4197 domain-containing protein n=1 Tax=Candidatus Nitrohelix vancouverensis TaxID=2705534 RepID=A0A7T0G532_9BACT|nr:MAG: DUF4197 domain-containing protein [Candidatus Nitrohelix vancouverensis]
MSANPASAGFLDDLASQSGIPGFGSSDEPASAGLSGMIDSDTAVSGLKEALTLGIRNAVEEAASSNGFLDNDAIRIPLPDPLQKVSSALRAVGYGQLVDDFEVSMNRAAEKAAPQAKQIFLDQIQNASIEDGLKILNGGDTAATEFLKGKTFQQLSALFAPIISSSLDQVGATRYFKAMMDQFSSLPFMNAFPFDLNQYVTQNSLDGLFVLLGEEEKNIRSNPQARATDLLKKVFQKQ